MRKVTVALLLALAMGMAGPADAQELRGSIEGTVKDASGGVLPGVTVEARNSATNAPQVTVTDASGAFRFPSLVPGRYTITATLSGFEPTKV
jgi:protocatechuate 3,4-dioxygenase beta subunit